MKKICLLIVLVFLGLNVHAQDNGFSVRAGVNIASMTNYNSKLGFHVGGFYRLQLTSKVPVFFEPGLMLQFKGGKITRDGTSYTQSLTYLEIPAMFSYRFRINDTWAIQPALGPYFAFGITGTYKWSFLGQTDSVEQFGSDGALKRGDMGLKIALGALINRIYTGIGYDLGLVNLPKNYEAGDPKFKNGSFYITAGYNF
ncbi:MAG TPA: PorT family protein [Candidatus Merdimorpha stercoravium]|uniref:PorT family protein n=1 Tax=Candidatus Merdimorpha stercoravium TaxID=2840863 RepID=A0A9D1HA46_9FLAO|nr:PorT family protein [Candidatus Merdimorpha stercoravium]